jgi:hypothetical protein
MLRETLEVMQQFFRYKINNSLYGLFRGTDKDFAILSYDEDEAHIKFKTTVKAIIKKH